MLGAAQTVFLGAAGCATDGAVATSDAYAQTVLGLPGLVAYWRLGQDRVQTGLRDASGNGHDGSYPTAPASFGASELAGAINTSDGEAVDFGATGYGEVAHDAAFELARGTLSFYFKATQTAIDNEHRLWNKNVTGNNAGDIAFRLVSGGGIRAFFQDGSTTEGVETPAGVIEAGVEYHVAIMWDEISVWLMLDGRMVDWMRNDLAFHWDLTANSAAWQFGQDFDGSLADVVLDEVVLYNRRLTWAEIDTLSEWARGLAYPTTPETSEMVTSTAELSTAIDGAGPGHHIILADSGSPYTGLTKTIDESGAKRRPIVIRPETPGAVTLQDCQLDVEGSWIVFADLHIPQCQIFARGGSHHCRVTRCTSDDLEGPGGAASFEDGFTRYRGHFWRFDHNDVSHEQTHSMSTPFPLDPRDEGGGTPLWARFGLYDHNYCHDFADVSGDREAYLVASSGASGDPIALVGGTFYRNYNTRLDNDEENVSIKSSLHLFIECTEEAGAQNNNNYHRQSKLCWVEQCWFETDMRILGYDTVYIGCHHDDDTEIWMGSISRDDWEAGLSSSHYPAAEELLMIGCTTGSGDELRVGLAGSSSWDDDGHIIRNPVFRECGTVNVVNASRVEGLVETGAGTAPIPYTAAVKLTTADVGPGADDPLVPPGYK